MNLLVVRLGALGDIVHAIPAAAALRRAYPAARIDWLVEAKHREILDLVPVVDRLVVLQDRSLPAWIAAARALRAGRYDVALDFQGLMKSAVLARASGAGRVLGFSIWHVREKGSRPFYSQTVRAEGDHVIRKNLRLLEGVGVDAPGIEFPLLDVDSQACNLMVAEAAGRPMAVINPGGGWPNKQWPPDRFAHTAGFVRDAYGFVPFVVYGPSEERLARDIVERSGGAARLAPPTRVTDLVQIFRRAALVVSGDTGPLHIAAAVGTPTVSIFGPTDPVRNGPWAPQDIAVSRYANCACRYDRRCHHEEWCLGTLPVSEVTEAIGRRLNNAEG